jgi:hypothetical protein
MTVQRNQPCPCGSGNKYKNCCERKKSGVSPKLVIGIVAVVGVLAIGAVMIDGPDDDDGTAAGALPASPGYSTQPPVQNLAHATLPPGAVTSDPATWTWNDEHFHWHTPEGAFDPTLDYPPPDHTWSVEHGHWHHKDGGHAAPAAAQGTDDPQAPPPGSVWSEEHGHFHAPEGGAVGQQPGQ